METTNTDQFLDQNKYPNQILERAQARLVYESMVPGYHNESPRPNREKSTYLDDDTISHVLYKKTLLAPEVPAAMTTYESLSLAPDLREILDQKFRWVEDYVSKRVERVQFTFLIMSSDWCGSKKNIKHVHPIIQRNPDRCIVWSFPIPIYIDEACPERHSFFWNSQENLFPKIVYMSHRRMRNLKVDYNKVEIPRDGSLMGLQFDAARSPHWIDNTGHMYLWMVFEGVEFKSEFQNRNPVTDLNLSIIR